MTKYCTTAVALLATVTIMGTVHAFQGAAPVDTAVADYDPTTGQMTVSVNSVNNWFISSASGGLTGAAPMNIPAAGGILSDDNFTIGETGLGEFSYTDVDLCDSARI